MDSVWKILDIEPTEDKKIIKRAYAKLLKNKSPEIDPVGFQNLRQAYETALSYADQATKMVRNEITDQYHADEHSEKQIELTTISDQALEAEQNVVELFSILNTHGEEEAIEFFRTMVSSYDIKDLEHLNRIEALLYPIVSNWEQQPKPMTLFYEIYDHYGWVGIGEFMALGDQSQEKPEPVNYLKMIFIFLFAVNLLRHCNNM